MALNAGWMYCSQAMALAAWIPDHALSTTFRKPSYRPYRTYTAAPSAARMRMTFTMGLASMIWVNLAPALVARSVTALYSFMPTHRPMIAAVSSWISCGVMPAIMSNSLPMPARTTPPMGARPTRRDVKPITMEPMVDMTRGPTFTMYAVSYTHL